MKHWFFGPERENINNENLMYFVNLKPRFFTIIKVSPQFLIKEISYIKPLMQRIYKI